MSWLLLFWFCFGLAVLLLAASLCYLPHLVSAFKSLAKEPTPTENTKTSSESMSILTIDDKSSIALASHGRIELIDGSLKLRERREYITPSAALRANQNRRWDDRQGVHA